MLLVVVVLPHLRFLCFWVTFPCHGHSTPASRSREGLHKLSTLPWLLSVALLFPGFSVTVYRKRFGFERAFLPTGAFYLALRPHILACFVTQMLAGAPYPGSSSVPALTKLFFLADAWSCTIHIVDARPLVYQLRQ